MHTHERDTLEHHGFPVQLSGRHRSAVRYCVPVRCAKSPNTAVRTVREMLQVLGTAVTCKEVQMPADPFSTLLHVYLLVAARNLVIQKSVWSAPNVTLSRCIASMWQSNAQPILTHLWG